MVDYVVELQQARDFAKAIPAFSTRGVQLTTQDGYQIQTALLEKDLQRGEKLVGYKMGLTSRAKQRDVNVHEPISGYLLQKFEIPKNGTVNFASRIHPRVEPEIAVVMKKSIQGDSLLHVVEAIGGIYPALEIVDSRYEDFKFQLGDVLADNTSAAHFMVGTQNYLPLLHEVRLMGVLVRKNGEIIETGAPAAVLGDPLLSVFALSHLLNKRGQELQAGQLILTGGITNSVPFEKNDRIDIEWPDEVLSFNCL